MLEVFEPLPNGWQVLQMTAQQQTAHNLQNPTPGNASDKQ